MSHLSLAKRREKVVKKGRRWYGWMDGGGLNFSSSHGQQMAQISGVSLSLPYPPPTITVMNGTFNITPLKGITGMYLLLLKH